MFQEADLAITDLTITSEREEAVDFTTPFMTLGECPAVCSGVNT
jgi:ABC-type amino acid transport substrate-binding protein